MNIPEKTSAERRQESRLREKISDVYQIGDNLTAFGLVMARGGEVASMDEILAYIEDQSYIGRNFTEKYIEELKTKMRNIDGFDIDFEEVDGGYRFIGDANNRENLINTGREYLDRILKK